MLVPHAEEIDGSAIDEYLQHNYESKLASASLSSQSSSIPPAQETKKAPRKRKNAYNAFPSSSEDEGVCDGNESDQSIGNFVL